MRNEYYSVKQWFKQEFSMSMYTKKDQKEIL